MGCIALVRCVLVLRCGIRMQAEALVLQPASVVARSKAWVYGRSLAGIVGSNPAGVIDFCLC